MHACMHACTGRNTLPERAPPPNPGCHRVPDQSKWASRAAEHGFVHTGTNIPPPLANPKKASCLRSAGVVRIRLVPMLALCLSGALAAPVSKSHHAVAAARSDFLVTETLSAEPSDYASDYGPDMEAQKKQLKALRKENRIAAEKVAEVSGDGKTAASMLQRHSHWDEDTDEDDEELSPRMAERKADHDKQVEAHKTEHEKQMHAKKKQHEKRKVSCKLDLPRSRY